MLLFIAATIYNLLHQFYNSHDIYKYYKNLIYECIVPNYHHIMSKIDICVYVQLSSFEMDNKTQLGDYI